MHPYPRAKYGAFVIQSSGIEIAAARLFLGPEQNQVRVAGKGAHTHCMQLELMLDAWSEC